MLRTAAGTISPSALPARSAARDRTARPDGPIGALLAEDNDVNALVLTRHLEKLGCRVTRAATGADAVTAAGKGAFEIIFMDWRMPEMDGLEAIRHIRRIERYALVPIVAVTANALPGDRETCLGAGADEYVTKPVDASVLRATLERFGLGPQPTEPA
ncbi:MAG: response regulator [Deltaproteobacteria bacterium]|nr:response regulator [Deltaproteobacteria bacterium]